jgi:arginyl-tRNA synthetase
MTYPILEAENQLVTILNTSLKKLGYDSDIRLEHPPGELGDFAFPCFTIASSSQKPPITIAEEIKNNIKKNKWIKKVEAKGPYVNFYLNMDLLKTSTIISILKENKKYGYLKKKNKKVIIEHTSANPNGPLHVGRARNPIIGDTIVRIFKTAGFDVESQYYLDNMGKQVAIIAWGLNNINPSDITKPRLDKPDHKAVGYYQEACKLMEENSSVSKEIEEIVKQCEEGNQKTLNLVQKAYTPILDGIKESLNKVNIRINKYIPESNFVEDKSVDNVVKQLKKSKYCGTEDGAYYLDMQPFGIQGRNTKFFFLRKNGTTLYATRDVAYHLWKADNADTLINVLGEDHKLESKQVEIGLKILESKLIPKAIFYAFVSLPGGKMSTRKGRAIYLDDLIDECIKRAYNEVTKRRKSELTVKQMKKISEQIGVGAIRYNIIKVQPEKDIEFKWEEALNFEGDASPFIQYSHARAYSILQKNKEKIKDIEATLLKHVSEINLIKKLANYPKVIDNACNGCKPHIITSYLFEIASKFNQFYRDCPVLSEKNYNLRIARLSLVRATRIVLRNGLDLLGISAPREM